MKIHYRNIFFFYYLFYHITQPCCNYKQLIYLELIHKLTGNIILKVINNEFNGDNKKLLSSVVYAVISALEFIAIKVNKAVIGFRTNDKLQIRILVIRHEIDMPYIRKYYKQLIKKDMIDDIKGDISGDYRKILLRLAEA